MHELKPLLTDLVGWCVQLVGIAWLLAAAYFAIRLPDTPWRRLLHFLRTLLPEPWLLPLLPVLFVVIRVTPPALWAHLRLWNPALAILGAACVVAATALTLWARWTLGAMWAGRPLVQERHELRTSGAYRIVRHPIYAGVAGLALGAMLVLGFGVMVVVAAFTLAFIAWRVWREERMLVATFGDQYRAYRRRVPALVPFVRAA
jgi:protein-S-isoprenylcysteine O-methyltransferase Ste14